MDTGNQTNTDKPEKEKLGNGLGKAKQLAWNEVGIGRASGVGGRAGESASRQERFREVGQRKRTVETEKKRQTQS